MMKFKVHMLIAFELLKWAEIKLKIKIKTGFFNCYYGLLLFEHCHCLIEYTCTSIQPMISDLWLVKLPRQHMSWQLDQSQVRDHRPWYPWRHTLLVSSFILQTISNNMMYKKKDIQFYVQNSCKYPF